MTPYLAEIRIFAGNFPPRGWALCNGQTMPIAQNTALYSLLGATFGGDGRSTFGLPNLQGRAAIAAGAGAGLSSYTPGQAGGQTSVTLNTTNLPSHNHTLNAALSDARVSSPTPAGGTALAPTSNDVYDAAGGTTVAMSASAVGSAGVGAAHNNIQPYLALTYIICLAGQYPLRS